MRLPTTECVRAGTPSTSTMRSPSCDRDACGVARVAVAYLECVWRNAAGVRRVDFRDEDARVARRLQPDHEVELGVFRKRDAHELFHGIGYSTDNLIYGIEDTYQIGEVGVALDRAICASYRSQGNRCGTRSPSGTGLMCTTARARQSTHGEEGETASGRPRGCIERGVGRGRGREIPIERQLPLMPSFLTDF